MVSCTVCANSSFRALIFKLKLGDLRRASKTDGASAEEDDECFWGTAITGANSDEALEAGVLMGAAVFGSAGACIIVVPAAVLAMAFAGVLTMAVGPPDIVE